MTSMTLSTSGRWLWLDVDRRQRLAVFKRCHCSFIYLNHVESTNSSSSYHHLLSWQRISSKKLRVRTDESADRTAAPTRSTKATAVPDRARAGMAASQNLPSKFLLQLNHVEHHHSDQKPASRPLVRAWSPAVLQQQISTACGLSGVGWSVFYQL